jgi:hypothetical protein
VRPTIIGPATCPAGGPPPQFRVDTAELLLYLVELAGSRELMAGLAGRTPDNYFFGGEAGNVFATGTWWRVPGSVWRRLCRSEIMYYRVVAVDPLRGTSNPSVEDDSLEHLPAVRIAPPTATVPGCAGRQE